MASVLQVRTAQYVTSYGPGALLEGRLSRVIPRPDRDGLDNWQAVVSAGELDPGPLAGVLAKPSHHSPPRLFQVPSNAALGYPDQSVVYRTRPFPRWRLCWNRPAHPQNRVILYGGYKCPTCGSRNPDDLEAVRFVLACPAGHLDDVPWEQVAHTSGSPACAPSTANPPHFYWEGGGGSLRDLQVRCPRCNSAGSVGRAFQRTWPCSGRFPELERGQDAAHRPRCPVPARLMQRGAAGLRVPEIFTAFRIRKDAVDACLERPAVRRAFQYALIGTADGSLSPVVLKSIIDTLVRDRDLDETEATEILRAGPERVLRLVQQEDGASGPPGTFAEVVRREFNVLLHLSRADTPSAHASATPRFATHAVTEVSWSGPDSLVPLRVAPAVRLETVMVQHAYRRLVPSQPAYQPQPVDIGSPAADGTWYPAVQLEGEGLFFAGSPVPRERESWSAAQRDAAAYYAGKEFLFRGNSLERPDELDPVFVWWHTLAHALVRVLAVEAGYELSGIRERVYVRHGSGEPAGGIMLYAAMPGSSGSLGGLFALVPHLTDLMERVRDLTESCSNDPLCGSHRFAAGGYSGAACHACLFLPETSCEHRNMWLDRRVLTDLPW
jgi:hypothetical protein